MMTSVTREWEAGRRIVIESVRPARPGRAIATPLFEPHEEGTRYTWSMRMSPSAQGGVIFGRLMSALMHRNARRQRVRFKLVMERPSA